MKPVDAASFIFSELANINQQVSSCNITQRLRSSWLTLTSCVTLEQKLATNNRLRLLTIVSLFILLATCPTEHIQ